jgi:hypothetical protein
VSGQGGPWANSGRGGDEARPAHRLWTPLAAAALVLLSGCGPERKAGPEPMKEIAETYVRLVLALGQHDTDYVDAYFGPVAWQQEAEAAGQTLEDLRERAHKTLTELAAVTPPADDALGLPRHVQLLRSLEALIARIDLLTGGQMSFDEEAVAIYDAEPPSFPAEHFQQILDQLDAILPGQQPLFERYQEFRKDFAIPADRLDAVFSAAIEACREKTVEHLELPAEESFSVEYVSDKSWSGYNWYQGGYKSLIQVNTDFPTYIDRALDLACHEGYPGHHVFNVLIERELFRGRGWMEFGVYPLFSPRSLLAEGTANFGIEVAFPADERLELERRILFPLAGLDPERAAGYYEVQELVKKLSYAGNEAARRYLDGEIGVDEATTWLATYALTPPDRARQRVRFIDQYRSYVINYNLGQDLVRDWVEAKGGTPDNPAERWRLFTQLLSTPQLPSGLKLP